MKFFKHFKRRRRKLNPNLYINRPVLKNTTRLRNQKSIRNINTEKLSKLKNRGIFLIVSIGIIAACYFLFFSNQFLITNISVVKDDLEDGTNPVQHYFNSLKNKNIIFANTNEVKVKILEDHPEIDQLEIKKRLPKTLQVVYTEFPIVANVIQNAEAGQKKYLINSRGRVAKTDIENPNLPYIKFNSEEDFKNKTEILNEEKLNYILNSIKYFEEKFGMKVFDAFYIQDAREIHLRTEKYFSIWLDTTQSYEEQFVKLKKALVKLDIHNDPLDYIDLRIAGNSGEKIIYKRK